MIKQFIYTDNRQSIIQINCSKCYENSIELIPLCDTNVGCTNAYLTLSPVECNTSTYSNTCVGVCDYCDTEHQIVCVPQIINKPELNQQIDNFLKHNYDAGVYIDYETGIIHIASPELPSGERITAQSNFYTNHI